MMMKEKDRKEKEAEELKKKCKEEREEKRSSLDTTPRSSSSSVIPESLISISSELSEDTIDVPCSSAQSPPLFSSTPVSSASLHYSVCYVTHIQVPPKGISK